MEIDRKVKEKREKFLKERLEEAHSNLELENDNSIRMFYEDEIKNLERWLKESESLNGSERDKEFIEWKIDFLKNWIKFLKDIIKYEGELSEGEINSIKDDEFFIRMYIEELKNDSIK